MTQKGLNPMQSMIGRDVHAVQSATDLTKVRYGTLEVVRLDSPDERQPCLRFVDDDTGTTVVVPHHTVTAIVGELRDTETGRRHAAWKAEERRRDKEDGTRVSPVYVRDLELRFRPLNQIATRGMVERLEHALQLQPGQATQGAGIRDVRLRVPSFDALALRVETGGTLREPTNNAGVLDAVQDKPPAICELLLNAIRAYLAESPTGGGCVSAAADH
jgi:hypothetical protein